MKYIGALSPQRAYIKRMYVYIVRHTGESGSPKVLEGVHQPFVGIQISVTNAIR